MTTGADLAIEKLNGQYKQIMEQISSYRKQGYYTKIAEMKAMNIPHKISYAGISKNFQDIEKINRMVTEVTSELREIEESKKSEVPARSIVMEGSRSQNTALPRSESTQKQTEIVKKTRSLIAQALAALTEGNPQLALVHYKEIHGIYKYLPKDLKKEIFKESSNLYAKILKTGIVKNTAQQKPQKKRRLLRILSLKWKK